MWQSTYECIHVYQVWKTVVVLVCVGSCLHEYACVFCVCARANQEKGKMKTNQQKNNIIHYIQFIHYLYYIRLPQQLALYYMVQNVYVATLEMRGVCYTFTAFFEQGGGIAELDSRPSHNTPIRVASSKVHVGEARPMEAQCHKAFPWS